MAFLTLFISMKNNPDRNESIIGLMIMLSGIPVGVLVKYLIEITL